MSTQHIDTLKHEAADLADRIARLTPRWQQAAGDDRVRYFLQIERLKRRRQVIAQRLHDREPKRSGVLAAIGIDTEEIARSVTRWMEHLDAKYAASRQHWYRDD